MADKCKKYNIADTRQGVNQEKGNTMLKKRETAATQAHGSHGFPGIDPAIYANRC